MANTKIVLDRQATARVFDFGTNSAGEEALVTIRKGTAAASTLVLDVKGSQNVDGDLTVVGNLNITGNINQSSVTELNVADYRIRVNDGGSTAGAAGAGLQVEGDSGAVIGAISFNNASAGKFQIGDGTTQVDIVTTSGTQTLTNKTIAGSQITGNISGNAANVTGTVGVANGGTGANTLTGVVIGNGTGAFTTKTNPSGAFIGDTDTQTLSNKTLTTPRIAQINDATNGLAALLFVAPASSVNQMTHTSAIAGAHPTLSATGSDTNINLNLVSKGTGVVQANGVEVVTLSGTQTLTNKTIAGSQITGNIGGNAANVTGTVAVGNGGTGATSLTGVIIGNGTSAFTVKTNPSGAFVGTTDTQTLTGKTLTNPQIGQINDATNNQPSVLFTAPASAVNQFTITSAASGGHPSLNATGSGTNININLVPKGTGTVQANGVDVVTLSGTQTLTNKTIAGSQITGNISGNAANVTGTVAVANGGTGLGTLTANGVLIGNGTSNPTFVAPGGSGNVLTSNGTTWISQSAGAPSQYFRQQTVTGTQDSVNKVFTLGTAVTAGTELVSVNGQVLNSGSSNDYVLSGTTLTFQAAFAAPAATDVIKVWGMN